MTYFRHKEYAEFFSKFIVDGVDWVNNMYDNEKKILIEGKRNIT